MKVLLISPLPALDPPCGDITYTEILLGHPPSGVDYVTYESALKDGTLVEHARRERFWQEPLLTVGNKLINVLRKQRVLFWEPVRFFSVKPGVYDVVHLHVFSAAFRALDCPLVVSSGAPQRDLYQNYRRYSPRRVAMMERAEKVLGRLLGVNCNSYYMPQAQRVLVYTEYYRDYLVHNGYVEAGRVSVVPILSVAGPAKIEPRQPKRIGFVARDFEGKGGRVLLDAYRRVRQRRPDVELWIVGSDPQLSAQEAAAMGITWLSTVPREALLSEIMPTFDVFAYPTPHDCFSYVMLEAMSCGAAIATSDYVSMPEAVDFGRAGLISPVGDAERLAENVLNLLEPDVNLRFRVAARHRFDEHFSWQSVAPRLVGEYRLAVEAFRSPSAN